MILLKSHIVPGTMNELIRIEAKGKLSANAETQFLIDVVPSNKKAIELNFQNGPVTKGLEGRLEGVNGITNEVLLAIVEYRLQGFQSGEFSCRENAIALTHIQDALMWLQKRTRDRLERGVEGQQVK